MGLIDCPDCSKAVSDRAPSCIHCGGPLPPFTTARRRAPLRDRLLTPSEQVGRLKSLAGRGLDATTRGVAAGSQRAAQIIEEQLDRAREASKVKKAKREDKAEQRRAAREVRQREGEKGAAAAAQKNTQRERAKQAARAQKERERLERRQSASLLVFLLPTGVGPRDFVARFDFSEWMRRLTEDRWSVPELFVWAARDDLDRDALASVLRDQFLLELNSTRTSVLQSAHARGTASTKVIGAETDNAAAAAGRGFGIAATAGMAMLLMANPLFDLLLLGAAVSGGAKGGASVARTLRLTMKGYSEDSKRQGLMKRVERDADKTQREFQKAVHKLVVHVHPNLHQLYAAFCEVEGRANVPPAAVELTGPDIKPYIQEPDYLRALPHWYVPLAEHYGGE
jgi:hypothetical protein